ncbi:protein FAR1-RELATED SEQUENCE 3-like [Asparagus officinalis]|uniref:protein FAR1-RELATED SEQUENCE 3-like n=1 Tax=Asparagus officinalis TaxID=4686 RepID=UPI00098DEEA7|nr:protein FAR1-RELATED SEQUENCE 3-like [Asparagus officinalis]
MEKQMAQIYTKKIFYIFQDELQPSLMYNIELVKENERESTFQLNFCGHDERLRHITYCKTTKMVSCSCLMFEFKGIPCRHILAYLKITNHNELPEQYILRRWCRNVKKRVVLRDGNIIGDNATINFASRFSELNCLANEMVKEGLSSNDAYELMREMMMDAINKVQRLKLINDEEIGQDVDAQYMNVECSQNMVHEPCQARTKGRPKGKRLKPSREIRKCRPRKCKLCGKKGQNHDSRNCPLKLSSDSMEQDNIDEATDDLEDSCEEDEVLTIV